MNFLGGANSLGCFLKAYRNSETKRFIQYEGFDSLQKLMDQSLFLYDDSVSRLHNCKPLEKTHSDYQNPLKSGYNSKNEEKKLKLQNFPPMGKTTMLTSTVEII